jgi:hypothetical protein
LGGLMNDRINATPSRGQTATREIFFYQLCLDLEIKRSRQHAGRKVKSLRRYEIVGLTKHRDHTRARVCSWCVSSNARG